MLSEPVVVVAQLARAFTFGIRYVVGGSLASSIYGIPRATPQQMVDELDHGQFAAMTRQSHLSLGEPWHGSAP